MRRGLHDFRAARSDGRRPARAIRHPAGPSGVLVPAGLRTAVRRARDPATIAGPRRAPRLASRAAAARSVCVGAPSRIQPAVVYASPTGAEWTAVEHRCSVVDVSGTPRQPQPEVVRAQASSFACSRPAVPVREGGRGLPAVEPQRPRSLYGRPPAALLSARSGASPCGCNRRAGSSRTLTG